MFTFLNLSLWFEIFGIWIIGILMLCLLLFQHPFKLFYRLSRARMVQIVQMVSIGLLRIVACTSLRVRIFG